MSRIGQYLVASLDRWLERRDPPELRVEQELARLHNYGLLPALARGDAVAAVHVALREAALYPALRNQHRRLHPPHTFHHIASASGIRGVARPEPILAVAACEAVLVHRAERTDPFRPMSVTSIARVEAEARAVLHRFRASCTADHSTAPSISALLAAGLRLEEIPDSSHATNAHVAALLRIADELAG